MKKYLLFILFIVCKQAFAQKIDSIYVNLYTDSLKKGTYNYINVDGLTNNGKYLPLDSTDIIFTATEGSFKGNSLYIPWDFKPSKVTITVTLRKNKAVSKKFGMWIKTVDNNANLKTADQILNEMQNQNQPKKKKKKGIFG